MSEKWIASARAAGKAVKRGAEVTANGVHQASSLIARQDGRLADGAQVAAEVVGTRLDRAGQAMSAAGQQASRSYHGNASRAADAVRTSITGAGSAGSLRKVAGRLGWIATKLATHTVGLAADAVNVAGKVAAGTGRLTERSAPAVGGAIGGLLRGAAEVTSNAVDAAALPASRIEGMRAQLRSLGKIEVERSEQREHAILSAQARRRKDELLDLLLVGGITLAQALRDPASVSANIERAFDLAYPGLTQTESFAEAVSRMSSDELVGFVSGVKGKLFELELVDHLNSGGLPDGFHAAIAESATQPGWDIQINDDHGQVSELLQAKATESVQYVNEALKRYPDIDVTTTTEVHAQLVAMGLAQHAHSSGISEAVLQAKVEAATHGSSAFDASDLVPSSIGLAVIALSVFMDKSATLRDKGALFGTRSAKAGVASVAGNLAMVATQTWWLGLIAGVGSSWLASRGHGKREQYEALSDALRNMKARSAVALLQAPV